MNRLLATLAIIGLFIAGVAAVIIFAGPIIVSELAYFVDMARVIYVSEVSFGPHCDVSLRASIIAAASVASPPRVCI
jgi:hypothetical protein